MCQQQVEIIIYNVHLCLLSHYKKVSLVTIYYLAKYQNRYKLQGPRLDSTIQQFGHTLYDFETWHKRKATQKFFGLYTKLSLKKGGDDSQKQVKQNFVSQYRLHFNIWQSKTEFSSMKMDTFWALVK